MLLQIVFSLFFLFFIFWLFNQAEIYFVNSERQKFVFVCFQMDS